MLRFWLPLSSYENGTLPMGIHLGLFVLLTLFVIPSPHFVLQLFRRSMLTHFSRVQLFSTLWTVAHQAPLSIGFSRQEHWSGLLLLPPGDLPDPGIQPTSLMSPALAGGIFTTNATWKAPSQGKGWGSVWRTVGMRGTGPQPSQNTRACLCLSRGKVAF